MSRSKQNESEITALIRTLKHEQGAAELAKQVYILARKSLMAALLRKRDYDFCRAQGLFDSVYDEDLEFEVIREVDNARSVSNAAKEVLAQIEQRVLEVREEIKRHREREGAS